jgi:MULE transposase domain
LRNFIAVDVCHCLSRYKQTLFIAAGIDANNNVLPLCWMIGQGENQQNWTIFFQNLKRAFAGFDNSEDNNDKEVNVIALMSDRQKGLAAAVAEVLLNVKHFYCTQYIVANVQSAYGIAAQKLF